MLDVCGGNGTSCLGCDGQPYGKRNDECGVCGGDGSNCFNPCANLDDCASCIDVTTCVWLVSLASFDSIGVRIIMDIASTRTTTKEKPAQEKL